MLNLFYSLELSDQYQCSVKFILLQCILFSFCFYRNTIRFFLLNKYTAIRHIAINRWQIYHFCADSMKKIEAAVQSNEVLFIH